MGVDKLEEGTLVNVHMEGESSPGRGGLKK